MFGVLISDGRRFQSLADLKQNPGLERERLQVTWIVLSLLCEKIVLPSSSCLREKMSARYLGLLVVTTLKLVNRELLGFV